MKDAMKEVLQAIADHDGQYSWYQLDRQLAVHNSEIIRSGVLMAVINKLIHLGYLVEEPSLSNTPRKYRITVEGRTWLMG